MTLTSHRHIWFVTLTQYLVLFDLWLQTDTFTFGHRLWLDLTIFYRWLWLDMFIFDQELNLTKPILMNFNLILTYLVICGYVGNIKKHFFSTPCVILTVKNKGFSFIFHWTVPIKHKWQFHSPPGRSLKTKQYLCRLALLLRSAVPCIHSGNKTWLVLQVTM